ncbi:hypothetical protein [Roseovarius sp. 2305UL8-3]|uniref:hypothetical protein n=1 Tax=Roseovarius conchicola TaxID=3121636 RepID=UPI0035298E03
MTHWAITLGVSMSIAGAASAQTLTPSSGGTYDKFTKPALACLAENHGAEDMQMTCLETAINECRAKAGVYEACLEALREALFEAKQRVEAASCDGDLDPVCGVLAQGQSLIAAGAALDAQTWAKAVKGED